PIEMPEMQEHEDTTLFATYRWFEKPETADNPYKYLYYGQQTNPAYRKFGMQNLNYPKTGESLNLYYNRVGRYEETNDSAVFWESIFKTYSDSQEISKVS